jgi:diguanylate cyclase (GGDEF)-like protein
VKVGSHQLASKLASVGLALVLLGLSSVTIWTIVVTQNASTMASRASTANRALAGAQYALSRATVDAVSWSRGRRPQALEEFQSLSTAMHSDLKSAGTVGGRRDRKRIAALLTNYDQFSALVVGLAPKHVTAARVRHRTASVSATASSLQARLDAEEQIAGARVDTDFGSLAGVQNLARSVVVVAFLVGIVLVGFCWWVLELLRRGLKSEEEALAHQALHDALTGLPNRLLLADRIRQALIRAKREAVSVSLLLMDLDRFKEVNDTFGHQTGDQLIQQVGFLMRSILRQSDTVARLGGDEFGVLLPNTTQLGAITAAQKLIEGLSQPLFVDGQSFHVGASIGMALYPEHGMDHTTLMRRADVAMYTAKREKSSYAIYSEEQDQDSHVRLALSRDLRYAVDRGELLLQYQPKADVRTREVSSVEALIRWKHPMRGLLFPDRFMGLAEQTGLVKPLSFWVLGEATRQCSIWHRAGQDLGIAINLSASSLPDSKLGDMIAYYLGEYDVPASMLAIEVTESVLMADPTRAKIVLDRLHELGVKIAIDDFGTGYSSLAYLRRLPVDEIKIDKSFVLDMVTDSEDALIVRSIIDLGHNLGLRVVAEGVENAETWALLETMGCDVIQGFYISRPLTVADLTFWMSERSGTAATA